MSLLSPAPGAGLIVPHTSLKHLFLLARATPAPTEYSSFRSVGRRKRRRCMLLFPDPEHGASAARTILFPQPSRRKRRTTLFLPLQTIVKSISKVQKALQKSQPPFPIFSLPFCGQSAAPSDAASGGYAACGGILFSLFSLFPSYKHRKSGSFSMVRHKRQKKKEKEKRRKKGESAGRGVFGACTKSHVFLPRCHVLLPHPASTQ